MFIIGTCATVDNRGYPKKIHFPPEGGTKIVMGEDNFEHFSIAEGAEEYHSNHGDTMVASHKWLTAKQVYGSKSLTVTAEPAPSGKKRKFYIYGYYGGYEYADITVVQGR